MKEFKGTMRVTPKYTKCEPYLVSGEWIYNEQEQCWYNGTTPYSKDSVEVVEVKREVIHKVWRT